MTVFSFKSKQFDIAGEPKNAINPLYGQSLANLLLKEFQAKGFETFEEPESEDWGWYFNTTINEQEYMVGTIAHVDVDPDTDEPILTDEPVEFMVQFDKYRSFKEMLFRKNKFSEDDLIFSMTEEILKTRIRDIAEFERQS